MGIENIFIRIIEENFSSSGEKDNFLVTKVYNKLTRRNRMETPHVIL